jgi:N-dimethylarginine dimethylaminohydrolase
MATGRREPRYSNEEFARRGEEIYERDIFPKLGPEDQGKVVVIEIETGDYEVDKDEIAAGERLRARHPEALFWFRRVGSPYLYRFGHHRSTAA